MTGPELEGAAETRGDPRSDASVRDVARAKINLTLEILGRRSDGYHELRSLVAFSYFGDELEFDPRAPFALTIGGPFAEALGGDNLIALAAAHYARASGTAAQARSSVPSQIASHGRGAFRLRKAIPVAAGLGGGSADAAAALRLLAGKPDDPEALQALLPLAAELGADVPVCLFSRPAMMTGIGESLRFLPVFPPIPALLVNPGVPLSTASVFRELRAPALARFGHDEEPEPALPTIDDVIRYAAARRNDLEAPARRLLPVIGKMLKRLENCDGVLLARLSGSGPTCFALFPDERLAQAAARSIRAEQPGWWTQASVIG